MSFERIGVGKKEGVKLQLPKDREMMKMKRKFLSNLGPLTTLASAMECYEKLT